MNRYLSILMMRPFLSITLFVLCCHHLVEPGRIYIIDGNKYYVSTPDEYYFYQSLEFCATNGMFLVDIRSEFEQNRINTVTNLVKKDFDKTTFSYWTSGTNTDQDGNQFFWLTTGEPVVYKNWNDKQPGSGGNLYILAQANADGNWDTSNSDVNATLICRDKVDTVVNVNGIKSHRMRVHRRKKATGIKLRKKSKHS